MNNTFDLHKKLPGVKKIAVLRANALGDFIVTLPALQAIKQTYPDAELTLLGKPWHCTFVTNDRTPVDRVITVPIKKGIRNEHQQVENEEEIQAFIQTMKHEQFDVVINMQGNGISANPFIKQFGAKMTAGLACDESEKLDRWLPYYYYQSEVIRFLEVAKLIGAVTTEFEPRVNVLEEDRKEVESFVAALHQKPFVVLHPVAVDKRRMWPLENYSTLADEIIQQGYEVIFSGSAEDEEVISGIIYSMNFTAINACGKFGLGGLSALLSLASVVISADTGPLHLARAVGAPTIGFYWAPNLINWGPLTRSLHRPLISWKLECPICGIVPNDPYPFEPTGEECDHPVSFVRDITIEQALQQAKSLMNDMGASKQVYNVIDKKKQKA